MKNFYLVLILYLFISNVFASSPMVPHRSTQKPFMEGWYTRLTYKEHRIAVVVGIYESMTGEKEGYVAVLTSNEGRLEVEESFSSDFEISSSSNSNFKIRIGEIATLEEKLININLPSGTKLNAKLSNLTPWKPISFGFGPESVGIFMPFKSHWYVHSLKSDAEFTYENPNLNIFLSGRGFAHQEKNWGRTFPSGWIWAQGSSSDGKFQFALAGGELDIAGQRAYLIALRTPTRSITFHPMHSISNIERLACDGRIKITVTGLRFKAVITIDANPKSFSHLSVPTENGFIHGAIESFDGDARVEIFSGPLKKKLIETFNIKKSALEFGGNYGCSN